MMSTRKSTGAQPAIDRGLVSILGAMGLGHMNTGTFSGCCWV